MALSVVVFDVGETLVDETTTYERWEEEGASTFVFAAGDLHADALPCLTALRARGLHACRARGVPPSARRLRRHAVRIRRGAHAHVEPPDGIVTIGSLAELPEALERV